MSIADVREAMATALSTIDGLRASPYLKDQVNPPEAMIDYDVDYDLTMGRGGDQYAFVVLAFVQRNSERAGQVFLDQLRDPKSTTGIKQVLEEDAALLTVVDYARVTGSSRPQIVTVGQVDYLMSEFQVEVVL